MIFRPVSPQSPCGPPTTNRPVGLMWYVIVPLTSSFGSTGLIDLLDDRTRRSRRGVTSGACWVETTTVSIRTGLSPSYSTVTWLLAVGPQPGNRAVLPRARSAG